LSVIEIEMIYQTKELYQLLLNILKDDSDDQAMFIKSQLELGIDQIDEYYKYQFNNSEPNRTQELLKNLERRYIEINQPRIGLSDYYIWKDDHDERMKANETLDEIKEKLLKLFRDI